MLQTRSGKRTAKAALKIAVELANEGLITRKEAVTRIDPAALDQLLHPTIDPNAERKVIATGLPASPGAASGEIVFSADEAETLKAKDKQGHPGSGRDLAGGHPRHARGRGHPHHARRHDLARRRGGARHGQALRLRRRHAAGRLRRRHDEHRRANVQGGRRHHHRRIDRPGARRPGADDRAAMSGEFATLMGWADDVRKLGVRANADTPNDARVALKFGAEGIGLCRTEHMFFDEDRIRAVREMILADDEKSRRAALAKLLPMQRADFVELFEIMQGLPVTIRLLDPPLHEFLPHTEAEIAEVAAAMNANPRKLADRARELHEFNPMLGFRGCRLAIAYPEIAEMQARAIFEAAVEAGRRTGKPVVPEVMVPLIATKAELDLVKARIDAMAEAVALETESKVKYQVGTMIELPRASLRAAEIAESAEFFSFGTNDLTQTTFGISRDDAASFLGTYMARNILASDPFVTIDREGVGELVRIGVERGRKHAAEAQGRHLRRAWRRPGVGGVLSRGRARLRLVLAVPRADRAACGGAGGTGQGGGGRGVRVTARHLRD